MRVSHVRLCEVHQGSIEHRTLAPSTVRRGTSPPRGRELTFLADGTACRAASRPGRGWAAGAAVAGPRVFPRVCSYCNRCQLCEHSHITPYTETAFPITCFRNLSGLASAQSGEVFGVSADESRADESRADESPANDSRLELRRNTSLLLRIFSAVSLWFMLSIPK